ncbi:MAG: FG-GAP repeat domain-containing protein, partial [Polyangiaceae bacterium]
MFGGFVALVAGGASCTSLPDIAAGTCGNGVVEPDHNEDCDNSVTDDAGKATCYPAGSAAQCHFDCSTSPSQCPSGFSCGIDGVCRKPKGAFAEVGHPTQVSADRLFGGDFDQDGHGDVVAETDVQMEVLYGDQTDGLSAPFVIRAEGNPDLGGRSFGLNPAVGMLAHDPDDPSSEATSDIVFTKALGVTTWRGLTDRTLVPTGYTSFHIGVDQPQFFTATTTSITQDVIMLLSDAILGGALPFHGTLVLQIIKNAVGTTQFFAAISGKLPAQIVGSPVVANFDTRPQSPCDEFVLAFGGDTEVDMYRTCNSPSELNVIPSTEILNPTPPGYTLPQKIALPFGVTVRNPPDGIGVHAADINGDGKLDLFIDAQIGSVPTTVFTYGVGDGTFSSSPELTTVDNAAAAVPGLDALAAAEGGGPLLAVAQFTLDADGVPDFVFPKALVLNAGNPADPDGGTVALPTLADIPWTEASFTDVDGDGFLDLLAGAENRVDLFRGSATALFTHVPYVVDGTAGSFELGDFDGDLALDIAFRASHADGSSDMNVMWGHRDGFPDNPFFIGRFPHIVSTTHGVVASNTGNDDAIMDLGILTETDPPSPNPSNIQTSFDISVLAGSPTRQLQSAYFLQDLQGSTGQGLAGFPLAYAVGQFTRGDHHPDLAIASAVEHDTTSATLHLDMKVAVAQGTGAGLLVNPPLFTEPGFDTFTGFAPGMDSSGTAFEVPFADWTRLSLAAVDFDGPGGDGIDEIVGIAPALTKAGSFFWAKLDGDAWKVEDVTPRGAVSAANENRQSIAQVIAADVNGDGADDVLLLSDTVPSSSL